MKTLPNILMLVLISFIWDDPDLAGVWQGDIKVQGNELTVVFHITKSGNFYEATIDSPNQNAKDIPVSSVKYDHPDVRFESSAIGMLFVGEVSGDMIKGTWKQSGQSFELMLTRSEHRSK